MGIVCAWPRLPATLALLTALAAITLLGGCLHLKEPDPSQTPLGYRPQGPAPQAVLTWAPAFVVHNPQESYNRMGRPVVFSDAQGQEEVRVDPEQPAIYYRVEPFQTARGSYTNLVFRVHFPATPWSLVPFLIGAGQNMGVLVVVTLDAGGRPLLVSTAGTCGCYLTMVPTDLLDPAALPPDWSGQPLEIYGERLPARLDLAGLDHPRLLLIIRPGEHRVMQITLVDSRQPLGLPTPLLPASELQHLPLPGGGSTSLFYQDGLLQGHVKGAWKPWETLILGLISLDGLVGMDKDYPDGGLPFYTSLKPWAREASDMRDFPRFLAYYGWRL
jgi:hypothetical protein